jgi:hypothetical protein
MFFFWMNFRQMMICFFQKNAETLVFWGAFFAKFGILKFC